MFKLQTSHIFTALGSIPQDGKQELYHIKRRGRRPAGTVDRVLHMAYHGDASLFRKSPQYRDDYPSQYVCHRAGGQKRHHIVCIIPYYIEHDYWHAVAAGIDRAAQELRPFNVS